jgi:hypothetical protein
MSGLRRQGLSLRLFYEALPIFEIGFGGYAARFTCRMSDPPGGSWMACAIDCHLQEVNMDDLLYLGLMVAFFALSVALVYGFEKLGRPQ